MFDLSVSVRHHSLNCLLAQAEAAAANYGLDVSFPIHHDLKPGTFQHGRYTDYMAGCYAKYPKGACDGSERARKQLNRAQPSTQQNYTAQGFAHVKAPTAAIEALQAFYAAHNGSAAPEQWPAGNTYTNHWQEPTLMLSLEAREFGAEGRKLKAQVWDEVRDALQAWTGEKLRPTSLYGIRVYQAGAVKGTAPL
jgi:prolyl 4-hydroxylase